jgi:hypothetical protein
MTLSVSGGIQKKLIVAFGLLAVVSVLWGGFNWWSYRDLRNSRDPNIYGNYGSYLQGAVASPWLLASVFLLAGAYLYQENQLHLQRQALADQNAQFSKQNFESTFFHLLNMQNQITSQMKITQFVTTASGGRTSDIIRTIEGRDCFEQWFANLKADIMKNTSAPYLRQNLEREPKRVTSAELAPLVRAGYESFFKSHLANLGPYFNNLYHLIEFVRRSEMIDKQWCVNLAAAQLSSYELALLFYHGMSPYGQQLTPLIQEFSLLKNMDESLIPQDHRHLYGAL